MDRFIKHSKTLLKGYGFLLLMFLPFFIPMSVGAYFYGEDGALAGLSFVMVSMFAYVTGDMLNKVVK